MDRGDRGLGPLVRAVRLGDVFQAEENEDHRPGDVLPGTVDDGGRGLDPDGFARRTSSLLGSGRLVCGLHRGCGVVV